MSLWSESSSSTQHGVDLVNYGHILSKTDDRACPLILGQIRSGYPLRLRPFVSKYGHFRR